MEGDISKLYTHTKPSYFATSLWNGMFLQTSWMPLHQQASFTILPVLVTNSKLKQLLGGRSRICTCFQYLTPGLLPHSSWPPQFEHVIKLLNLSHGCCLVNVKLYNSPFGPAVVLRNTDGNRLLKCLLKDVLCGAERNVVYHEGFAGCPCSCWGGEREEREEACEFRLKVLTGLGESSNHGTDQHLTIFVILTEDSGG